jgi:hypothetical protein
MIRKDSKRQNLRKLTELTVTHEATIESLIDTGLLMSGLLMSRLLMSGLLMNNWLRGCRLRACWLNSETGWRFRQC